MRCDIETASFGQGFVKMKSIKAIFRRGQGKDIHGQAQGQGDDISRSSSISNLNAESKAKGALLKSRKSASRDRLDKIVDKKHEKKGKNLS